MCKLYFFIKNNLHNYVQCSGSLTKFGTEGHFPSSSWYSTTVGPSWTRGVTSTSQSDELGGIPHKVEAGISIRCLLKQLLIRITPLSQSSLIIIVSPAPTTIRQVSMASERRETTTISVLSNGSDEDLGVVSSDVG